MFAIDYLGAILNMKHERLDEKYQIPITRTELLKLFGALVLMARYEFSSRRSLWDETISYKYVRAPTFSHITTYSRFEAIRSSIRFSMCPIMM